MKYIYEYFVRNELCNVYKSYCVCLFTKIFLQEKEEYRCVYGQKNIWIFRIREQGNEHEMGYSVLKELRLGPLYIEPSM